MWPTVIFSLKAAGEHSNEDAALYNWKTYTVESSSEFYTVYLSKEYNLCLSVAKTFQQYSNKMETAKYLWYGKLWLHIKNNTFCVIWTSTVMMTAITIETPNIMGVSIMTV